MTMNLTSVELASWVQAIGTIVAVIAAAAIAIWQSKKQHKSALAIHKEEVRFNRASITNCLREIASNCSKAATHFGNEMNDRQRIHEIATGEKHFDLAELHNLEKVTSEIPLFSLPNGLVTQVMILSATVRQLRQTIEIALRDHRTMNAEAFENLFRTLRELNESLRLTCGDIDEALIKIETDA